MAQGIGDIGEAAGGIVGEVEHRPVGLGDPDHLAAGGVLEPGDGVVGLAAVVGAALFARGQPAAGVVLDVRHHAIGVLGRTHAAGAVVAQELADLAEGVGDFPQIALAIGATGGRRGAVGFVAGVVGEAGDVGDVGARAVHAQHQAELRASAGIDARLFAVRDPALARAGGRVGRTAADIGHRRRIAVLRRRFLAIGEPDLFLPPFLPFFEK